MNTKGPARGKREKNVMAYRKGESVADLARRRFRYRGVALIWSAILMIVMIGLVGLSIDWGKLAVNVHQMQNAADAAALAGAQVVKTEAADFTRQQTHDIGIANAAEGLAVTLRYQEPYVQPEPFVDDTNLDIILGRWINHQRRFFATLDTPDAVMAIARRNTDLGADAPALAMIFGPVFGVDTVNARRVAVGWHNQISGAGLIVLDEEPNEPAPYKKRPGLEVLGTGRIGVIGGSIHVNAVWEKTSSNDAAAVYVQGNGKMLAGRMTLTGVTDPSVEDVSSWDKIWMDDWREESLGIEMPYDIGEESPYMPDPLEYCVPPTIPTNPADPSGYDWKSYDESTDGSTTLYPGYYPNGIKVTQTGTVLNLEPGIYIIGGGNPRGNQIDGLYFNGGTVNGEGVQFYLTKDYMHNDGKWAQLDTRGNAVVNITPPGDLETPRQVEGAPGISFWQDRHNQNVAQIGGGGGMNLSGTLYFPENHVYLAGNPGKTGNQILCGSMQVEGTANVIVEYDGRNNQSTSQSILVR